MDFLDIVNYENLLQINKLNKEIQLLTIDINDFENKKKSNLHFLNIQKEFFEDLINKKTNILKKYNFKIIKNIINMHMLKEKNNELNKQYNINKELTIKYNKQLVYFSINTHSNTSPTIKKLLNKYNNLINDSEYISLTPLNSTPSEMHCCNDLINTQSIKTIISDFKLLNKFIYLNYFQLTNLNTALISKIKWIEYFNNNLNIIYKYSILKKVLNIEFKHYYKFKTNIVKQKNKLININNKFIININKNNNQINLLYKKTKDLKNKFNNTFKDIKIQENNNIKLQSTMNSNIHELNIRIGISKQKLNILQLEIEEYNHHLHILNNTKGDLLSSNDICSICLEELPIGITTKCNHHFHYGCINLYIFNILQQNNNLEFKCPICRQYI